MLRTAAVAHLAMDRPYLPWLYLHLYDYFIFTGWPLVFASLAGVVFALRAVLRRRRVAGDAVTDGSVGDGAVLALSVAATLVVLDFSGTMRGESGRILLFMTPLLLPVAAGVLAVPAGPRGAAAPGAPASTVNPAPAPAPQKLPRAGWVLTLAQVAVAVTMIATLRVIGAEFNAQPPVSAPPQSQPPTDAAVHSGATFAGVLHLDSFAGHVESRAGAGGVVTPTLVMWLDWHSDGSPAVPYYMSLIPVAPGGQAGSATLVQPFDQQFPVTCWLPRSGPIHQRIELPLQGAAQVEQSAQAVQGSGWWVSLSLMDRAGNAAPVVMPGGQRDKQVGLGAFFPAPQQPAD